MAQGPKQLLSVSLAICRVVRSWGMSMIKLRGCNPSKTNPLDGFPDVVKATSKPESYIRNGHLVYALGGVHVCVQNCLAQCTLFAITVRRQEKYQFFTYSKYVSNLEIREI